MRSRYRLTGPTWVYEMTGYDGTCLYVGVTQALMKRLWAHRARKPWWSEVEFVHAALYETRKEALLWEALGIWSGAVYNVAIPPVVPLPAVTHPYATAYAFEQLTVGVDL